MSPRKQNPNPASGPVEPSTADMMSMAEEALETAMHAGAEWCDVSVARTSDVDVEVENGSIKSMETASTCGFTVRAYIQGAQGVASATGFERKDLPAAARSAVDMAKAAQSDPDFRALPSPSHGQDVEGLYDDRIAGMQPAEAVDIAVRNIADAKRVEPKVIISGGVGFDASHGVLASSTGVRLEKRGTSIHVGFFSIVKRGDDAGSFYDFDMARMFDDLKPFEPGRVATEQALRFLGARKVATRHMAVVLGPLASFSFLRDLAGSTNAESIQRRRSFMVGRLGTQVASPLVTLADDGLIPRGIFSGHHDGEGALRRRVTLFEDGVFRSCLHNSYTAGKAGEPNTGHGGRTGGIGPTNLVVQLGEKTAEEIIADTDEGVYINMGSIAPDPASGDISASVDFGFKIEKGKLAYPVVNTMVSGHVFEFLKNLDAVSSDYREEPGNKLPTIRIRDVQVAGSK
jgi:PmbA protein